ncbi:transposase [Burkholderia mayonis]|uniref:transposase n=1 Tax=Burkholderia mayonis TaxID=1385591 RepID=UPI0009E91AF8|nr:transposase [Burkholderia mayonis]
MRELDRLEVIQAVVDTGLKPGRAAERLGSKNYTREFRAQVVAETRDPGRLIAEVARSHGLNANLLSIWRRK